MEKFTTIDGDAWRKSLTRARKYRKIKNKELNYFIKQKVNFMNNLHEFELEQCDADIREAFMLKSIPEQQHDWNVLLNGGCTVTTGMSTTASSWMRGTPTMIQLTRELKKLNEHLSKNMNFKT